MSNVPKETIMQYGPVAVFFHALLPIENSRTKVQELIFQLQFTERVTAVRTSQATLLQACQEITSSDRLRRVLEIILKVGNVMNAGTHKGDAAGFTLDSLAKLVETKGKDKKTTLLDYVAKLALKSDSPQLSGLKQDMPGLDAVSKLSLDELAREISSLDRGLKGIENGERGVEFASHARADMTNILEQQVVLVNTLNSTESYFSGSVSPTAESKTLNREAVKMFQRLHTFVAKFDVACSCNRAGG